MTGIFLSLTQTSVWIFPGTQIGLPYICSQGGNDTLLKVDLKTDMDILSLIYGFYMVSQLYMVRGLPKSMTVLENIDFPAEHHWYEG